MTDLPRILVTYTTNAGSTKEVAQRVAEGITRSTGKAEVIPSGKVEYEIIEISL